MDKELITVKIIQMKTFKTIDQCVEYLTSLGCKWNAKKETELVTKHFFRFNGVIVMYDPFDILA